MSLCVLPTELDELIAASITSSRDLAAFCQTSRHYHQIAEPFLYDTLVVNQRDRHRTTQLFLTLIRRPALALHIRVLCLSQHSGTVPSTEDQSAQLWRLSRVIRKRVNEILAHTIRDNVAIALAARLFGNTLAGSADGEDSMAPLMLCMAKNVRRLDICESENILDQVLRHPWTQTGKQPLSRLNRLNSCCCGWQESRAPLILPSMRVLDLESFKILETSQLELHAPQGFSQLPNLSHILLGRVSISPSQLGNMIQSPGLTALRHLTVNCASEVDDSNLDEAWDMAQLLRKMEKHLPLLRHFCWIQLRFKSTHAVRFDTFKNLKSLESLIVSNELMAGTALDNVLNKPACFPLSLVRLVILDMDLDQVARLIKTEFWRRKRGIR